MSNSILLVTFANDARSEKKASKREAGKEEEGAEHAHDGDRDVGDASEAKAEEGAGDERDERDKNPKSGTKGAKNEAEAEKERYKPHDGMDPLHAAFLAGRTRLRPVIMTALAMLLGMLPMAFGLGEGGEQNAPLGRAVIGGILAATMMTLFVVPCVYAIARQKPPRKRELTARIDDSDNDQSDDELAKVSSGEGHHGDGEGHEGNEVHA